MSSAAADLVVRPRATAGDLAVINLESSRARSWHVLERWPDRPGTAARIVEKEQRREQFLGDASALDRLADLSSELCRVGSASPDAHLVAAEVASIRHHFADAKEHLRKAEALGAPADATRRIKLAIAQAFGEDLSEVLAARVEMARSVPDIQNLVPLGALFADIGEYEEADSAYARAIQSYRNASPLPLAWACFQLGVLWGETAPERDRKRAAQWYERAMEYLPMYVKARVHLAEIRIDARELAEAESLLLPARTSGDPEVHWRLAEVFAAQGWPDEADGECEAARFGFGKLLERHDLAFADHAAEFYLSCGADPERARRLAELNLVNRPTLRAFELACAAASMVGDARLAFNLAVHARGRWGRLKAFAHSPLNSVRFDSELAAPGVSHD